MHARTGLLLSTWDLTTPFLCSIAIIVCLSFYIANKTFIYLYLAQRVHDIRNTCRIKDYMWYIGVFIVIRGFSIVATFAFILRVDEASKTDDRCRIGLLLVGHDVTINVFFTAIFMAQASRWFRCLPPESKRSKRAHPISPNNLQHQSGDRVSLNNVHHSTNKMSAR